MKDLQQKKNSGLNLLFDVTDSFKKAMTNFN